MKNTHLIKSAYNVFFNKIVIESKYNENDKDHSVFYECNHEWFGMFYTFATQFLKKTDDSVNPDDISCGVEI